MRAAVRSEWIKLRRPRMLVGIAALGGALAALMTLVLWLVLPAASATPEDADSFVPTSLQGLGSAGGMLSGYRLVGTQLALVSFCFAAVAFTQENRWGTWRNLVVRMPDRRRLLTGKLVAVLGVCLGLAVVEAVAAAVTSAVMALARGVPVAWGGADSIGIDARTVGSVALAAVFYAVLGAAVGLIVRSAPVVIGVGLGWFLVGETVAAALTRSAGWLTHVLPGEIARGLVFRSDAQAVAAAVVWSALLLVLGVRAFARRDLPVG